VYFVGGLVCRYGEKGGKENIFYFFSYVVLCACLKSEKLQQSLLIGLFKTITREEQEEVLQRKVKNFAMRVVIKMIPYY